MPTSARMSPTRAAAAISAPVRSLVTPVSRAAVPRSLAERALPGLESPTRPPDSTAGSVLPGLVADLVFETDVVLGVVRRVGLGVARGALPPRSSGWAQRLRQRVEAGET